MHHLKAIFDGSSKLHNYTACHLMFLLQDDTGWGTGTCHGKTGKFPVSRVHPRRSSDDCYPTAVALQDYKSGRHIPVSLLPSIYLPSKKWSTLIVSGVTEMRFPGCAFLGV